MVPACWGCGEISLLGCQVPRSFLLTQWTWERQLPRGLLFIRATVQFLRMPPSWPDYLPNTLNSKHPTLEARISTWILGGHEHYYNVNQFGSVVDAKKIADFADPRLWSFMQVRTERQKNVPIWMLTNYLVFKLIIRCRTIACASHHYRVFSALSLTVPSRRQCIQAKL